MDEHLESVMNGCIVRKLCAEEKVSRYRDIDPSRRRNTKSIFRSSSSLLP